MTMSARFKRSRTDVVVHIIWATKQREKVISPDSDLGLQAFLRRKAESLRCDVFAVGNSDDHVHVVVRLAPTVAMATLVRHLKGALSFAWNNEMPRDRRLAWQDGYWAESCAPRHLDRLLTYVTHQRQHHATGAILAAHEDPDPTA